jgi:hypothetical protein
METINLVVCPRRTLQTRKFVVEGRKVWMKNISYERHIAVQFRALFQSSSIGGSEMRRARRQVLAICSYEEKKRHELHNTTPGFSMCGLDFSQRETNRW